MARCQTLLVVYDPETLEICRIINPEFDWELNDPSWTKDGDNRTLSLLRMPRGDFPDMLGFGDIEAIVQLSSMLLRDFYRRPSLKQLRG